ncbi:hypothetical protein GCM10010106_16420 [Thermopolyspora flexuosa]|jgi:archaellum biogenesis protein FlaJ (TadC family)|uniref:Uncharacterized protein n=1 Tax=Thermopolyspora flexuosa TaxID=103836 RepID=A0A543IP99_9ACTN|nr:hypothetical protein [Thermopolyspora flexuosa]TQM72406.1 hypothetical protein FHX40_4543 [Thermopolyspora flexuosa]GGM70832.1 hypothetical protein GCM10010106_16420 [Thermopolyspora flexuosa]
MPETNLSEPQDHYQASEHLFRTVHEIASAHAGRSVPEVMAVLRQRLPGVPGLDDLELRRLAEQISVGRDPSGLGGPAI